MDTYIIILWGNSISPTVKVTTDYATAVEYLTAWRQEIRDEGCEDSFVNIYRTDGNLIEEI